jgi:hypothetical protein
MPDSKLRIERIAAAAPAHSVTYIQVKKIASQPKLSLSLLLVSVSEVIELLGPSLRSFSKSTPPVNVS